jgi:hypothetical protein
MHRSFVPTPSFTCVPSVLVFNPTPLVYNTFGYGSHLRSVTFLILNFTVGKVRTINITVTPLLTERIIYL